MSNALIYAINEIQQKIPGEILMAGMNIDELETTINMSSLGDKILRKVIRKRVMLDANILGGIETTIPLNNIAPSFFEQFYTIYQIPGELTNNKEIISALSISFMPASGYFGMVGGQPNSQSLNSSSGVGASYNPIMNVADRIGNAASSTGVMSNAHLELVAYNTVLVYAHYRSLANFGLRVILENDSNLNNLQPRSYKQFSMLCTLAVKAYIYNKLIIALNNGYLSGGQDLGIFKAKIESFESAEDDYNTYLREVWAPTAFQNDTTRMNRFIGSMIAPDL
jgi:hypothetical protein